VLRFLGVASVRFTEEVTELSIILPWVNNGNLLAYLTRRRGSSEGLPDLERDRLVRQLLVILGQT
jgi:hypothetical protein